MTYDVPTWAANAAVLGAFCSAVLFAILYSAKAPWWLSWMGRNLFFFDVAVALAFLPDTLNIITGINPDGEFFQWLTVGVIVFVGLLILHRVYLLLRVQRGWNWRRSERSLVPLPDVQKGKDK